MQTNVNEKNYEVKKANRKHEDAEDLWIDVDLNKKNKWQGLKVFYFRNVVSLWLCSISNECNGSKYHQENCVHDRKYRSKVSPVGTES